MSIFVGLSTIYSFITSSIKRASKYVKTKVLSFWGWIVSLFSSTSKEEDPKRVEDGKDETLNE